MQKYRTQHHTGSIDHPHRTSLFRLLLGKEQVNFRGSGKVWPREVTVLESVGFRQGSCYNSSHLNETLTKNDAFWRQSCRSTFYSLHTDRRMTGYMPGSSSIIRVRDELSTPPPLPPDSPDDSNTDVSLLGRRVSRGSGAIPTIWRPVRLRAVELCNDVLMTALRFAAIVMTSR